MKNATTYFADEKVPKSSEGIWKSCQREGCNKNGLRKCSRFGLIWFGLDLIWFCFVSFGEKDATTKELWKCVRFSTDLVDS